jgi:hypothetical protein
MRAGISAYFVGQDERIIVKSSNAAYPYLEAALIAHY